MTPADFAALTEEQIVERLARFDEMLERASSKADLWHRDHIEFLRFLVARRTEERDSQTPKYWAGMVNQLKAERDRYKAELEQNYAADAETQEILKKYMADAERYKALWERAEWDGESMLDLNAGGWRGDMCTLGCGAHKSEGQHRPGCPAAEEKQSAANNMPGD